MKFTRDKQFIGRMFDEISPSYDFMNHLMSGGQDLRWRKKAVKYLRFLNNKYDFILDLAAGSGDFGRELIKLDPKKIYSADLSASMLKINSRKINSVINNTLIADAEELPFRSSYFDLCGIAFGIRNFENLALCLKEINRVLKPGAFLFVIEMFKPQRNNIPDKLFRFYFNNLVPKIGNVLSGSKYAYNYLHFSVDSFHTVDGFISKAGENGFEPVSKQRNFLDIVYSVCLRKRDI